MHKFLPSTTLCYKACTLVCPSNTLVAALPNHSSCFTEFSQSFSSAASSQKDWRKEFPSTSSCCKICTKWLQYYLSTAKLRRSGCQYNFVLHSLQKVLPSTSSCYFYHKARTNYFLAPLLYKACTNKSSITSYKTSCIM